jgi:hypothetical protein
MQRATAQASTKRKTAMTTQAQTKFAAFALAVLTSVSVLGAVTAGMQPRVQTEMQLVALDAVTVTATKIN